MIDATTNRASAVISRHSSLPTLTPIGADAFRNIRATTTGMVCTKCQKTIQRTELATPAVKRKNEMYYGSPGGDKNKATLSGGISKNKLLSKSARTPYAAYSSSCETCKTKTEQGRKYCQRCAFKANVCAMCGKSVNSNSKKSSQPIVQGQRFSAK